ncbi:MAG: protein kinase [Anaerolineales bacterium]
MQDLEGSSIKGYELRERIGAGGYGAVFRAFQSTVGREVAIKIILPGFTNGPDFIRRFETEAQLVARLEHLHIAPLYDYWREPSGAYLVMRYLRGGNLRDAMRQSPYDLEAAALLLDQVSSALAHAHANKVIHRDIKPENILMDEDGNAYLADFGIAKDIGPTNGNVTEPGMMVGSPDYLAPEQARSEPVTVQTDIYSLGVVLYEVLAGEHPFPDLSPVERLFKHINEPIPGITGLDSDVTSGLNAVIQKATAKNPDERFSDVGSLATAFREAAGLSVGQPARKLVELLTPREQEVLKLIVEGKSNREIAESLTIELTTVKWYVTQIYRKLGVRSRVQAIVRARELNLIVDGQISEVATTGVVTGLPEPENPYKGLQAFQVADEHQFYGREKLIEKLLSRLQETGDHSRFLAIVGPSGSGKSSLVRAGLIPALWRGGLPESDKWFIADMIPGTRPQDELEIALLKIASEQPAHLMEQLERDKHGLHRATRLALPDDDTELLLVIDQFEELFTLVDDEERRSHFLDLIVGAVEDPRSRVRVVVTLRADFYDRPLQYPGFGELMQNRIETVLPLSAEELERAIARPAEGVGVKFEEGLVTSIIQDVHSQPGALPLMQYALRELFDERSDHTLTREAYLNLGGSVGALAKRVDEIYQELDEEGRMDVRQMFLRLVTLGEGVEDTRRRVARSELLAVGDDQDRMDELIDLYIAARLLSSDIDPGTRSPTVELAHEAILREWERLREWLDESREDIRLQRALALAAAEWRTADRDPSFLLRGTRLGQFENWSERSSLALTQREKSFLDASVQAAQEEQQEKEKQIERELAAAKSLRRRAIYLTGALVVSVGLAIAAMFFAQQANQSAQLAESNLDAAQAANTQAVAEASFRATAEAVALDRQAEAEVQAQLARSKELAAASVSILDENPELAILLALESIAETPSESTESASGVLVLRDAIQANRLLRRFPSAGSSGFAQITLNGSKIYTWYPSEGKVTAIDVATGKVEWIHLEEKPVDSGGQLAISPDGALIAYSLFADWSVAGAERPSDGGSAAQEPSRIVLLRAADGQVETVLYPSGGCPSNILPPNAFSPAGRWLIVRTGTEQCGPQPDTSWFAVFDTSSWDEAYRLDIEGGESSRAEFTDSSDRVLLTSIEGPAILLSFPELEIIRDFGNAQYATVSPDGKRVAMAHATTSDLFSFRPAVFDVETGRQLFFLDGVDDLLSFAGIQYSPDGSRIVAATWAHDYVFDASDGRLLSSLGEPGTTYSASFTEDALRLLTVTNNDVLLWDISDIEIFYGIGTLIEFAEFEVGWINPNLVLDGPNLAVQTLGLDGAPGLGISLGLLNDSGQVVKELNGTGEQLPDGRFIVNRNAPEESDRRFGPIVIWDPETDSITALTECTELESVMDTVNEIDCPDGEPIGHPLANTSVVASSDGRFIAAEGYSPLGVDNPVWVWDASTLEVRVKFDVRPLEVAVIAGPGWIVMQDRGTDTLVIRDLETGEAIAELHPDTMWFVIELSPDDSLMYATGFLGDVWVFDTSTWEVVAHWQANDGRHRGLAVSPDGEKLVTTAEDDFVKVWDVREIRGASISNPPPLLDRIPAPKPSDAAWLDADTIAIFIAPGPKWEKVSLSVDDLVSDARSLLTRGFTASECATYQIDPCRTFEEIRATNQ